MRAKREARFACADVIPGLRLGGWSASTDGAFLAAARVQEVINNCAGTGDVTPAIVGAAACCRERLGSWRGCRGGCGACLHA